MAYVTFGPHQKTSGCFGPFFTKLLPTGFWPRFPGGYDGGVEELGGAFFQQDAVIDFLADGTLNRENMSIAYPHWKDVGMFLNFCNYSAGQ
ncbi:hypothetical protein [Trichloromonas acetexigens]|uniref:Uncharacterized protein n=1 Tax=Trichloromonas acetexigens TaxID=38815 RepID=A0A550JAE7_9BACT|nr:hypothetical protein [Desulfuromonas acetexigens]TRO80220.1 hypothetical protein FL622_11320 [Desulfuromonas acetexigens]